MASAEAEAQRDKSGGSPFPLENIYAERRPEVFRKFLKHISLMPYIGNGRTGWKHGLDDGFLFRKGTGTPFLFSGAPAPTKTAQSGWITNTASQDIAVGAIDPDEFLTRLDTAKLRLKGTAPMYSLGGRIMYRIWKVQLGAGYAFELYSPADLSTSRFSNEIGVISTSGSPQLSSRYSAYLAYDFYRKHRLVVRPDLEIGKFQFNKKFTSDNFKPSLSVAFGITSRIELSEFFSWFVRPAIDLRSYKVTSDATGITVNHRLNTVEITTGFLYTFPDLRKCYHKSCRVQINHPHGNREYRSRAHPFYKKQNPGYGENYPEPVKTNRR